MKPEVTLKLTLNKETIRRLTERELQAIAGGATTTTPISERGITGNTSCCHTTRPTITVSGQLTCTEA